MSFANARTDGDNDGFAVNQGDNDSGAEDKDSAWHIEAQYRYQLNDNIAINPGFFVVINPENNSDNDTIYVGTIRTIFEFQVLAICLIFSTAV